MTPRVLASGWNLIENGFASTRPTRWGRAKTYARQLWSGLFSRPYTIHEDD